MKSLAAVLECVDNIRLEERTVPQPGKNDVRIRMDSVGICGSDVHYWTHGAIGDFVLKDPMVLGHEASGIIESCGSEVVGFKAGDRVAIEPGVGCRMCTFCKEGRYNLCEDMRFCATPPVDGNLCQYFIHPADFCFKLPEHVSLEEGALMEPLAVGVHACTRAGVTLGMNILICGAGPIGLVNLLTAKAMGATNIVVTDIAENRLKVAKDLGANGIYNVPKGKSALEMAKEIKDTFFQGESPDVTIECSGVESSIRLAILSTRSGGTVVLVGLGAPEIKLPIVNACVREVDIRGIFRYSNCYPKAIALVASGAIDVKPLVTHRLQLEETEKAFEIAKNGTGGAIKVVIKCNAL